GAGSRTCRARPVRPRPRAGWGRVRGWGRGSRRPAQLPEQIRPATRQLLFDSGGGWLDVGAGGGGAGGSRNHSVPSPPLACGCWGPCDWRAVIAGAVSAAYADDSVTESAPVWP